jgi:hypothetical protein
VANPSINAEQTPPNTSPNQKNESKESSVSPDIPHLEHVFRALTNWNLGLLIVGGAIALAIGGLSVAVDRVSGQLFDAKEAEGKAKQLELAKAQKEAADAQLALQRASAFAAAPRRIILQNRNGDTEIRASKFKELSKYASTPATIVFVRDDEAEILAHDIAKALAQAGWKTVAVVNRESTPIPLGYIQNGVQVHTFIEEKNSPVTMLPPPGHNPPPIWTALFELLNLDLGKDAAGTPFGITWTPDGIINGRPMGILMYGYKFPKDGIVITVGHKPTEQIFWALPEPAPVQPAK